MKTIEFAPKWKEELICRLDDRQFVLELTMGTLNAFLPTKAKWEATAPDWARHQWERVHADLEAWCKQQKIPLVVEDHAWVEFR